MKTTRIEYGTFSQDVEQYETLDEALAAGKDVLKAYNRQYLVDARNDLRAKNEREEFRAFKAAKKAGTL